MPQRRRTLPGMDEELERLLAEVADIVIDQGGDEDAVYAILRQRYPGDGLLVPDGDTLSRAQILAVMLLNEYAERDMGPRAVQGRLERRRELLVPQPAQRRGWGRWRAAG